MNFTKDPMGVRQGNDLLAGLQVDGLVGFTVIHNNYRICLAWSAGCVVNL